MFDVMNRVARNGARRSGGIAPYKMAGKSGTAQVFTVGQNEVNAKRKLADACAITRCSSPSRRWKRRSIAVAVVVENGRPRLCIRGPDRAHILDAYLLTPDNSRPKQAPAPSPPSMS